MWLIKIIFLCLFFKQNYATSILIGERCTGNNQEGTCMLITNCAAALREIRLTQGHKMARCGFEKNAEIVCCPQKSGTDNAPKVFSSRLGVKTLRPADQACKKIVKTYEMSTSYILGGKPVELGEFPHMVALGYLMSASYSFLCGGSLITTQYVITAVHCVDTMERIRPTLVRVGVVNITGSEWNDDTDYEVDIVHTHPEYKRSRKYHDLCLIRLVTPIRTSVNAFPACLYTVETEPTKTLYITGWGKTDVNKAGTSKVLLKAQLLIVPRKTCNDMYPSSRKLPDGISDGQICAGDSKGIMDTCQGDSGGPLQGLTGSDNFYRIVGVTSFGLGCGSTVPGVYTRIYKYLDWIESLVWPAGVPE